jgi:oligoendopeptidase F
MTNQQQTLPQWDLTDFYTSLTDPKIEKDFDQATTQTQHFKKAFSNHFVPQKPFKGCDFFEAIERLESIEELLGKLMSFAYLNYATNMNTPEVLKFFQSVQERITTISADLLFFTLDINQLSDAEIEHSYQDHPALLRYKPWLDSLRLFKAHQLTPDLEKLLHEKSVTGRNAWVRLYDETCAQLRFSYRGHLLPLSDILDKFSDQDPGVRKEAAYALHQGLENALPILTLITNTLAKDKEIEDRWRQYSHPVASRNLANQVEDDVVNALTQAVQQAYPQLSHRYYRLKAKWLDQETIEYWDRNAPLPEAEHSLISWEEAKSIVSEAYHQFSPTLAEVGQKFFTAAWIDVPPNSGKHSGAFSHPTVPSVHPYILLNYHGKLRDVMTLAHELGHGVHQVLAAEHGYFLSNTPLTLAETASVFGEMLTFQALLKRTSSPQQRKSLIAAKVEDMLNTVVRQTAFFTFEQHVHTKRKQGELSAQELGEIWLQTQKEALGPSVHLDPATANYWSYISHFIHAPFYVYAYAFGDCLVNSLYSVYQSGHPDFARKYLDLLKAGGTKRYPELLAPFHLDARDPQFWGRGLQVIVNLIDELETL